MSNPSITADKTPWYQWDTGLTVTVSGGAIDECHFANRKQGTAYVQAVINGIARVPDELLQVAAPIKAYGYVSDGAGGQTYVEQTFEVIARNIPADYTYTKTSQKTIRDAEAARDQAVQAAKDAKASELAADDSAVEASESAQSAGESASAAATSASNAADSASAAEQSATDASNAKVAAQTAKAGAEVAKGEAAASASNAAASATAAANSASDAAASVSAINVIAPKNVEVAATSEVNGSVAVGAGSVANKEDELSVGNETLTREITHVSTPTADTSAATKKYTDDNDAKTLVEANKYTDANTSNALVGTVSGKLLHVEDAWPGKPLGLTIDGAYKQDGTPSPENPVPIVVVENPVLKVTGSDTSAAGASLTITLPAEHPYLAALPDGTHDEIVVSDGKVSINCVSCREVIQDVSDVGNSPSFQYVSVNATSGKPIDGDRNFMCNRFIPGKRDAGGVYVAGGFNAKFFFCFPLGTFKDSSEAGAWFAANPTMVVYRDANGAKTIDIGPADNIPELPETISNVLIEANLTPECSMTYKRDVNVVIADLTAQINALKGTPSNDEPPEVTDTIMALS